MPERTDGSGREHARRTASRRRLLRASVGGLVGAGAASTAAAAGAQPAASVAIEDQESDGSAVVVGAVSTSVAATLSVSYRRDDGVYEVVGTRSLSAGNDLTDVTVSLREPLERTSEVSAVVRDTNSETLAVDSALVAVGDDLDDVGVRFVGADPEAGFEYPTTCTCRRAVSGGPRGHCSWSRTTPGGRPTTSTSTDGPPRSRSPATGGTGGS
jgi:hypothetical protein